MEFGYSRLRASPIQQTYVLHTSPCVLTKIIVVASGNSDVQLDEASSSIRCLPFESSRHPIVCFSRIGVDASVKKMERYKTDWAPCGKPDLTQHTSEDSLCLSHGSFDASPRTPYSRSSPIASPSFRNRPSRSQSQPLPTSVIDQSATIEHNFFSFTTPSSIFDCTEEPPLDVNFDKEIQIVSYLGGGSAADVYEAIWRGHSVASDASTPVW